jgi:hypothetical protein
VQRSVSDFRWMNVSVVRQRKEERIGVESYLFFIVLRSFSFFLLSFFWFSIGEPASITFKPLDQEIPLSELCFEFCLCRWGG